MTPPENVFVKSARYLGDYRIAFRFTDGHSTEVDFHGFLTQAGQNPMATQFLDVTRFKDFAIDGRADIVWGDWEMCFPFAALYAGDLAVDSLGRKRPTRMGASGRGSALRKLPVRKKRVSKEKAVK